MSENPSKKHVDIAGENLPAWRESILGIIPIANPNDAAPPKFQSADKKLLILRYEHTTLFMLEGNGLVHIVNGEIINSTTGKINEPIATAKGINKNTAANIDKALKKYAAEIKTTFMPGTAPEITGPVNQARDAISEVDPSMRPEQDPASSDEIMAWGDQDY